MSRKIVLTYYLCSLMYYSLEEMAQKQPMTIIIISRYVHTTLRRTTMAVVDIDIDRPSQEERDSHYKPGSIKRVKLKNFLTYDAVEFFPGPR